MDLAAQDVLATEALRRAAAKALEDLLGPAGTFGALARASIVREQQRYVPDRHVLRETQRGVDAPAEARGAALELGREYAAAIRGIMPAPAWARKLAMDGGVPVSIDAPGLAQLGASETDLGLLSERSDVRGIASSVLARAAAGLALAAPVGPAVILASATDSMLKGGVSGTAGAMIARGAMAGSMVAVVPAALLFFGSYWVFEFAARRVLGIMELAVGDEELKVSAAGASRALVLSRLGMLREASDDSGGTSVRAMGLFPWEGVGSLASLLPAGVSLAGGALAGELKGVLQAPTWDAEQYAEAVEGAGLGRVMALRAFAGMDLDGSRD